MRNGMGAVLAALLLAACRDDAETAALYARERALPPECSQLVTPERAQAMIAEAVPTVPARLIIASRTSHEVRRDKVTGIYTFSIAADDLTGRAVAHEAGHVRVFDAYAPRGPFEEPPPQPPLHGAVFVRAYKDALAQLVSKACAEAL